MRISDWSSDVCSSDLSRARHGRRLTEVGDRQPRLEVEQQSLRRLLADAGHEAQRGEVVLGEDPGQGRRRSEEHTSELQSLMRISYAVFCLKKKKEHIKQHNHEELKKHRYRSTDRKRQNTNIT